MLYQWRIPLTDVSSRRLLRFPSLPPAFAVLDMLLYLTALPAVVLDAALRGITLTVYLFAAKGTAQILTAGVAWMGKKEDMAMLTARQAPPQVGMESKNRP